MDELKLCTWCLRSLIFMFHNCYIPYTAEMGNGAVLAYKGMAVIIHGRVVIGEDCVIGSCVTIGGGAKK